MRPTSRPRSESRSRGRSARLAALVASSTLTAFVLASCGPKADGNAAANASASTPPATVATPPADIAADTAAAAQTPKDQPNFRVCLSNSLDQTDSPPLTVPAGVIFESWGRKKGDERNPSLDPNALAPDAIRYVVVLDAPIVLSKATPCAQTVAQTVLSPIYEWTLPLVRNSQDLQFQVGGVENHMAIPLTDRLGDLVKRGLIFGFPTADIGNPRQLARED
jgi:hypothetical protein